MKVINMDISSKRAYQHRDRADELQEVAERLIVERDDLRAENERLKASFDAHHPPNLQQGYRCDVCGEEHPGVISTQVNPFNPFAIEDECDADD